MAHKASLVKDHFPAVEDSYSCLEDEYCMVIFRALEGGMKERAKIAEHNFSMAGGNWEGQADQGRRWNNIQSVTSMLGLRCSSSFWHTYGPIAS